MVNWLELLNRTLQLFSLDSLGQGVDFIFKTVLPNISFWAMIWFLFTILVSGFFLLVLMDHSIDQKTHYDFLESFCLAGTLGFCFVAQLGYILDLFFELSIASVSISIGLLGGVTILLRRNIVREFIRGQTIQKRHLAQLLAVLAVGTFIRLYDNAPDQIISSLAMPYKDPHLHFFWGHMLAVSGHAFLSPLTPTVYPNGFAYIIGTIFLPNDTVQNYYLAWLFIPFMLVLFSTLSIYIASLKVTGSGTAALFSSLIFNTSWLILQRTRALLSDNFGFVIVPLLLYLMFDTRRKILFAFLYGSLFIVNPVPALWVTVALGIYCLAILAIKVYMEREFAVVLALVWAAVPSILLILLFSAPQWLRSLPIFFTPSTPSSSGNLPSVNQSVILPASSISFNRFDWYYFRDTGPFAIALAIFGTVVSFFSKSKKILYAFVCMFIATLILAHFHIVFFTFIQGHKPKRILMYNVPALSVLASTGLLKMKEYLAALIQSKRSVTAFSQKVLRVLVLVFFLQQLAVGAINAGTYYFPNDFRNEEIRALFWLDQNAASDATIVEYTDHQVGRIDVRWFLYPRKILKDGYEGFYALETPEEIIAWAIAQEVDFVLLRTEDMPEFYGRFHAIIAQMSEFELVFQDEPVLIYKFQG